MAINPIRTPHTTCAMMAYHQVANHIPINKPGQPSLHVFLEA